MKLIDTHVHLDDAKYDFDRDELVQRAKGAGVETLITIGTTLDDSRWVADYVGSHPGVYGTVGQHPELVDRISDGHYAEFKALAQRPGIVAVGEVGLDFHRPEFTLAAQEPVFRRMIALAREVGLPLVIHNRDANADTLRVLREAWDPALGGVFHCFAGDLDTAKAAVDLNFDLAVGGVLTYKTANGLREIIAQMPLDRLVLETDGPWLAPQAWRGKRNEPAYMTAVAQQLADLKGVSLQEVAAATTANARRVFRLDRMEGKA